MSIYSPKLKYEFGIFFHIKVLKTLKMDKATRERDGGLGFEECPQLKVIQRRHSFQKLRKQLVKLEGTQQKGVGPGSWKTVYKKHRQQKLCRVVLMRPERV